MAELSASCRLADANVRQAMSVERRFPRNVFAGDWATFFFFDSDWMRVAEFVHDVKAFLEIEHGHCACLLKLDSENADEPRAFFISERTTDDEYRALLAGQTPGFGWLDAMERLACASDTGEWCIYCEPNNEMAVIALRHDEASSRYSQALARFRAVRIGEAIKESHSFGFSDRALSTQWRDELVREYASRAS